MDWFVGVIDDDLEKKKRYRSTASYISVAEAHVKVQEYATQRHLVRWSDTVDALRCFMRRSPGGPRTTAKLVCIIIQWPLLIAHVHAVRLALQGCGDRFPAPVASW